MKRLESINIENKSVVLRCDYNVPIKDGKILDDLRISKSLKTINYLLEKNCKIIILSHLGRIKSEEDKKNNSLEIVAKRLSELLNKKVYFINACYGKEVYLKVKGIDLGNIVVLENTRFMDFPNKLESNSDSMLAQFWASLGDIFVLDAFGCAHRAHSSTSKIAEYIPGAIGFLMEEELNNLSCLITDIKRPFTVFMGGAKIEDKLPIIKKMLPKCDYLLVGGGIANSFLKSTGFDVKNSLATTDESLLEELKNLLDKYSSKIVLPSDFVWDNDAIVDLKDNSVDKYLSVIAASKTFFVNGTVGKFEIDEFQFGTKKLFEGLNGLSTKIIAGGGDTSNAIKKFNVANNFDFISSGGGATLEYIADGTLKTFPYLDN